MIATTRKLSPALLAASLSVLAAGCGDDDTDGTSGSSTPSTATQPATPTTSISPGDDAGSAGSDAAADLDVDDQSGDGSRVVVARVSAPQGGFVVVTVDDDDGPVADGTLLGAAAVPAGISQAVEVGLDPVLTQDTELTVTLHADTDGDGSFDAAVDRPVPEPQDDDDDDDDVVDDDLDYTVG